MMSVWDNGEGDDWPHGPYGNLYYGFLACHLLPDIAVLPEDIFAMIAWRPLRGPHWTGEDDRGHKCEWNDNETTRYNQESCLMYEWNPEYDRECVVLMVYESDTCEYAWNRCHWGDDNSGVTGICDCCVQWLIVPICVSRSHDIMGTVQIHREDTESMCGQAYDLYAYTEWPPRELRCQPGTEGCSPSMRITVQTITP